MKISSLLETENINTIEDATIRTGGSRQFAKIDSLRSRADEVLIAIAVLGLVATISDGYTDIREIETFMSEFRKRFALSRRKSVKLIGVALKRISNTNGSDAIDCACDTLNQHLDTSHKIGLFETLADVLIADGRIHESEEYYLDYIASKLNLQQLLKVRYSFLLAFSTVLVPTDKN